MWLWCKDRQTDDLWNILLDHNVKYRHDYRTLCTYIPWPLRSFDLTVEGSWGRGFSLAAEMFCTMVWWWWLFPLIRVPAGSPSRGGDVKVYVLDINQPSLPTPFTLILCLFLSYGPFSCAPQWGAADTEIKVPSGENTELKRSPFQAWSRSVYSHTCYAYLFLPFQSIHLHFFQNLSQFLPVLASRIK